jgi:hypothetical protein
MNKHSTAFKRFLLEDHLYDYPTQCKEYEQITETGIVLSSNLTSQEINKYSHLTNSEYNSKLQKLLDNTDKAIDTDYEITGIEDEESVVYIQNLDSDTFKLVSYQQLDRNVHGVDSLVYSGEISIAGRVTNEGTIPMVATHKFSGILDRNRFSKLDSSNNIMMATNMVSSTMAFLEQLNQIKSQNSKEQVIRYN